MAVRRPFVLLLLATAVSAGGWPFGSDSELPTAGKLDLWNLGLLGAKASDAAQPPPSNMPPRSGVRTMRVERPPHDEGPTELRVEILLPDGPAAKAGLRVGDRIVGAGRGRFREGHRSDLAKALVKAEANGGAVTLLVEREGEKGPLKLEVAIGSGGRAAAKPTQGEGRDRIVDAALAWLATRQAEDGSFEQTLSGNSGAVVAASMAGLAWMAAGSDLAQGPYQAQVRKVADYVCAATASLEERLPPASGSGNWNQSNWGLAYGAMFLGALHARTPDEGVKEALLRCAEQLVKNQEESGGWAHGPGGPNALGYVELNIVTGLALWGLGMARQAGYGIPEECLAKAEAYLQDSGSGDGGVGYSTMPGQKGAGNIGRTAGAWLGYRALGLGKSGWARKMESYTERHIDEILDGHASLMQHVQLAGLAAAALDGRAEKEFWKALETDLVLARAPDGSIQPRPWAETIGNGSNSDVSFGEVWTTASWAAILAAPPGKERPGLPELLSVGR